jgi:signal transduction histidine kinase
VKKQVSFYVILFLFAVLLHPGRVHGQEINSDSLWKAINALNRNNKTELLAKKQKLSDFYGVALNSDVPLALRVTDSLAETCRLLGDSSAYYEALYRNKATVYYTISDYIKILDNLRRYSDALIRIREQNGYAFVDIGNQYYGMSLNDIAAKYYNKADELFRDAKNDAGRCTVLDNLAFIWRGKNNLDSCLYYYNKSLSIRRDVLKDNYLVAYTWLRIANVYRQFKRNDEALRYTYRCLGVLNTPAFRTYKDYITLREHLVTACNFAGAVHIDENHPDSAFYYLDKAEALAAEFKIPSQQASAFRNKARLLIAKKQFKEALQYLEQSEAIVRKRNDGYALVEVMKIKATCYERMGKWETASNLHRKYLEIYDSLSKILNDDQTLVVNEALIQFENETKIANQRTEISEKERLVYESKQEQRNLLLVLIGLLLLMGIVVYVMFLFRRKNKLIARYNNELETANATKEKFLSVISHDLRGPFNTLIGMSNVLVTNLKSGQQEQAATSAEAINDASRKAYVLLDNLMQWVSLQKEKINVNKTPVQLTAVVDELLLLFRNQAMGQSVTITRDIRVEEVITDRNLLQVILRNLLSNAIRHIPVGGKVIIQVIPSGNGIQLVVEDNGKGLDAETLKSISSPGDHLNVARKGSGLGLELVREFAAQLGGSLEAGNVPGGGARFIIFLPGVLAGNSSVAGAVPENAEAVALTPAEKQTLLPLVAELLKYEFFDTTELRKLLDQSLEPATPGITEWKKRVQQAIFNGNEIQYRLLIQLVNNGDGNI